MLVIRMQRTGRKGHAMFRVVVQDSRQAPTSGKVVARLGSHDPHAKTTVLDKEKAAFYLEHGAQPSDRAVRLLKSEGVKLPGWVKEPTQNKRAVRNPDKRRSTAPEKPAEETGEAAADETSSEQVEETPAEETPAAESGTTDEPAEQDAQDGEESATEADAEPAESAESTETESSEPAESEKTDDSAASEDSAKDEA